MTTEMLIDLDVELIELDETSEVEFDILSEEGY
jgi:hypothetical protein